MSDEKPLVTLPVIARHLGVKRGIVERLVEQYRDRVGLPQRVGITRVWPSEIVEQLQQILAEEERAQNPSL